MLILSACGYLIVGFVVALIALPVFSDGRGFANLLTTTMVVALVWPLVVSGAVRRLLQHYRNKGKRS